jgi:phospholipase D
MKNLKNLSTRITVGLCIMCFVGGVFSSKIINNSEQPNLLSLDKQVNVQICFTPYNSCLPIIIKEIDKAQQRIFVQAYDFTSKPILNALLNAKNRGVDIQIILDKSNLSSKHSLLSQIKNDELNFYIDKSVPSIAHNKIMIIDDISVITGSYNLTEAAEKRNSENLLVIKDPSVASLYYDNWKRALKKATPVR